MNTRSYLAFDFGERRIGVAIGNDLTATARALTAIDASNDDARFAAVGLLVREWQPEAFVVGRPTHPDGTPHAMTARCERFARQLHGRFTRPAYLVDERYTSVEAAKTLVDKLTPRDRMAIVTDDVELLTDFTSDKGKLKKSLDSLKKKASGNRLGRSDQYSALFATLRELVKSEERPIILFQTDGDELYRLQSVGEAPRPDFGRPAKPYSFQDIYTAAQKSRVTIYTIVPGIQLAGKPQEEQLQRAREIYAQRLYAMRQRMGNESAEAFLARMRQLPDSYFLQMIATQQRQQLAAAGIAKLTGGWAEFLETPEQAAAIYDRILSGINRRYILGYYPTNDKRDGALRKVKIEVKGHPEYRLLGKQSYYARDPEK